MSGDAGRRLWPPSDTALDRAWRQRQWRLQRAHDDWALHPRTGDPRAPIHRAAGLVRMRRQTVRDKVRSCRRVNERFGERSQVAVGAICVLVRALRAYRSAVAELARAVAIFDERNEDLIRRALPDKTNVGEDRADAIPLPVLRMH